MPNENGANHQDPLAQNFSNHNQRISTKKLRQRIQYQFNVIIICFGILISIILYFIFTFQGQIKEKNETIQSQTLKIQKLNNQTLFLVRQLFTMNQKIQMLLKSEEKLSQKFNQFEEVRKTNYTNLVSEGKSQILNIVYNEIDEINQNLTNLKSTTNILILNELSKEIKGYEMMAAYSEQYEFQISKKYMMSGFKDHFKKVTEKPLTIKKEIEPNRLSRVVESERPFLKDQRSYFQIRILKTQSKDLAIGVQSDDQPSKLYYFYAKNARIYQGGTYWFSVPTKQSNIKDIKENDLITLFYDHQLQQIIWYVNKKYVAHIVLTNEDSLRYFYPMVVLTSAGDKISIL